MKPGCGVIQVLAGEHFLPSSLQYSSYKLMCLNSGEGLLLCCRWLFLIGSPHGRDSRKLSGVLL